MQLIQTSSNYKMRCQKSNHPPGPPRGTHISASGALIQNRLDESSNLVQEGMHAKFQPNRTIRLVRARGVVRFLTPHFVIGRCLYLHLLLRTYPNLSSSTPFYWQSLDVALGVVIDTALIGRLIELRPKARS